MNPLHILHLEDNPTDAELIAAMLAEEGLDCAIEVVEDSDEFNAMLAKQSFDLILADYSLPSFDGLAALKIVQKSYPIIPFILVSGTLGEEIAIESLKAGATDYVLKTNLNRLAPAVKRAVKEAEERATRLELETLLQQTQKMDAIGTLTGGIAHDFNNMLNVILGYSEMALKKIEPSHSIYHYLESIQKAAKRSATLTHQLMAFSRQQPLEPKVFNLNNLVQNLGKMLRRVIGEDIDFKMVYTNNLDLVKADPGQIEQILMNLTINARDAMPDGGKLTIETTNVELDEQYAQTHIGASAGHYVLLTVSDTGCGMDEETIKKIFDPFFTTKETGKGTGLGLSTVYGIVKQSRGYILCHSEPGKGTTFKLYLPRTDASATPKTEQQVAPTHGNGEVHLLVVEDEVDVRNMLETMLKELHYQVTIAANGDAALLLYKEQGFRPDLIITDVVMPGMGGKRLVEQVQKTLPEQKVLYMSGYTDEAIGNNDDLDTGIHFIQKPFTLRGIAAKIKQALGEYR